MAVVGWEYTPILHYSRLGVFGRVLYTESLHHSQLTCTSRGLKDVVGELRGGATPHLRIYVGVKHSGAQFCCLTQIFVPECFALPDGGGRLEHLEIKI